MPSLGLPEVIIILFMVLPYAIVVGAVIFTAIKVRAMSTEVKEIKEMLVRMNPNK